MDADAFTPEMTIGEIVLSPGMPPRAGRAADGRVKPLSRDNADRCRVSSDESQAIGDRLRSRRASAVSLGDFRLGARLRTLDWMVTAKAMPARFRRAAAALLILAAAGTLLSAETIVRRDASGRVLETITIQNDGSKVVRDAKGGVIRRESKPREGRAEVRDERGRVTERKQTEPDGDLMIRDGKGGVVGTQKVRGDRIEFRDDHGRVVWTAVEAPDGSRVYRDAKGRVMAKESIPRP